MSEIESLFSGIGGSFITPAAQLRRKIDGIKAIIFDWDGVFNQGQKADSGGSPFSEPDAMGINLLRFSFWLRQGTIPPTAILSGEDNPGSRHLALREHYAAAYLKSTNKKKAFDHFLKRFELSPNQVAFIFDDVLDLGLAEICGLRVQVRRRGSPMFTQWVARHGLADYVTGQEGGQSAVREACELLMGLADGFDQALVERKSFSPGYSRYLDERNLLSTELYLLSGGEIKAIS